MLPLQLAGIALPGIMLLSKYNGKTSSDKRKMQYRLHADTKRSPSFKLRTGTKYRFRAPSLPPNPLGKVFRGLTATLSQLSVKPPKEDYETVIKSFLPSGAVALVPQYPANSKRYYLADLDGDSRKELVTSFKHNNEIKTIILKKREEKWYKSSEISSTGYDTVNYRAAVNMAGNGSKHLLLGLATDKKDAVLYGYTLEGSSVKEVFNRPYHKFEVLKPVQDSKTAAQLAVWEKKDAESYDIKVLELNGKGLAPVENAAPHYYRSVIPHYVQLIKQTPYAPSNWYNLADALSKAGVYRDALTAIDVGTKLDKDSAYKEKFTALKKEILGK